MTGDAHRNVLLPRTRSSGAGRRARASVVMGSSVTIRSLLVGTVAEVAAEIDGGGV